MEYVYSAMLLHSAGKEISEANITKVLEAAGAKVDSSRVKALQASLEGIDIEEAMSTPAVVAAAPQASSGKDAGGSSKKPKDKKEEKKDEASEEEAAAGLSALFG